MWVSFTPKGSCRKVEASGGREAPCKVLSPSAPAVFTLVTTATKISHFYSNIQKGCNIRNISTDIVSLKISNIDGRKQ